MLEWPSLYGRYKTSVLEMSRHLCPTALPPLPPSTNLRPWQQDLEGQLEAEPEDRSVLFVVDSEGNQGKTWFSKYWYLKYPEETQLLSIGKKDDLAYAIDESKRFFFINVPRTQMEFLSYSVLEAMKDRIIFSGKYESTTKILSHTPHVVVMCNEHPDMNKLSADRYHVITLE